MVNKFFDSVKTHGLITTIKIGFSKFTGINTEYVLKYNNRNIYGGSHFASYAIYQELLVDKFYDFDFKHKVETVVDLGANTGIATLFFKNKFPFSKIVCVEPAPENVLMLKKNTVGLDVSIVPKPVWFEDAKLSFNGGNNTGVYKFINREKFGSFDSVTVPKLMKDFNLKCIDLLKVDIEGGEHELFKYNNFWLSSVRYLVLELHGSDFEINNTLDVLVDNGFVCLGNRDNVIKFFYNKSFKEE